MFEYRFADDSAVSLYWYRGEIVVTGAVNELMAGAFVWLAESLGARLVGDDSEEFSRQPDEK